MMGFGEKKTVNLNQRDDRWSFFPRKSGKNRLLKPTGSTEIPSTDLAVTSGHVANPVAKPCETAAWRRTKSERRLAESMV